MSLQVFWRQLGAREGCGGNSPTWIRIIPSRILMMILIIIIIPMIIIIIHMCMDTTSAFYS